MHTASWWRSPRLPQQHNFTKFIGQRILKREHWLKSARFGRCEQFSGPKKQEVTDQTGYCWEPRFSGINAASYFGHQKFGGLFLSSAA
jgi:hypothetical protein